MQIEKGQISSSQLVLLIVGFIQGSTLTVTFSYGVTRHDTWLVVLTGLAISIPFALVYIALVQKFPGKNLVQINDLIYGPYLGKLFSAFYLLFFLSLSAANLRYLGDFILTYVLPETPMIAVLIMFTFVCSWAVRSGIEVIARCNIIFVVVTTVIVGSTFVLLLQDMKLTNFLPVFVTPLKDFIHGTHVMAAIPFGETAVFLMVMPYLNKIKHAKSSFMLGLLIGAITLLTVTFRDIAVLGNTITIISQPSFEAVRLINIAKIITRLEIFVAVVLLVTFFIKISLFYYATLLGTAHLFSLRSYGPLILPMGILIISFTILIADSTMEQVSSASNIWPFYTIPGEFLLPSLTLLVAKIRGLPENQGGKFR